MDDYTGTQEPKGFLETLGERLRTQDNRCTADPIFVVFQKRREYGIDAEYTDDIVWCHEDGECDAIESARLEAEYKIDRNEPEGFQRLGYFDRDEFVTACFTEQGAKDYMQINGHNLKRPHIYAASLFRNREMIELRKWIASRQGVQEAVAEVLEIPGGEFSDRRLALCEIAKSVDVGTKLYASPIASIAPEVGALTDKQIGDIALSRVAKKIVAGVKIAPEDWLRFARDIEQAVRAQYASPAPRPGGADAVTPVFQLCVAYDQGFTRGERYDVLKNPYEEGTQWAEAYRYGFERAKELASPQQGMTEGQEDVIVMWLEYKYWEKAWPQPGPSRKECYEYGFRTAIRSLSAPKEAEPNNAGPIPNAATSEVTHGGHELHANENAEAAGERQPERVGGFNPLPCGQSPKEGLCPKTLEAAAKVCDSEARSWRISKWDHHAEGAALCAKRLRALSSQSGGKGEENG